MPPKPTPLTKQDLGRALERTTAVLTESIRGLNTNFQESQAAQDAHFDARLGRLETRLDGVDARLDGIDAKLDVLLEQASHRRELANLVRELKAKGIDLADERIFLTPPPVDVR